MRESLAREGARVEDRSSAKKRDVGSTLDSRRSDSRPVGVEDSI